jgi:hypothetical protein
VPRYEWRLSALEQALPADLDTLVGRFLEQVSDLELGQLLAMIEAIQALPTPQRAEATALLMAGVRRCVQGVAWHHAIKTTHAYVVAVSEARLPTRDKTSHTRKGETRSEP